MKSKEIRRILKNSGLSDIENLDKAVREIFDLFNITIDKRYSVITIAIFDAYDEENEILYNTDNLEEALIEYKRLKDLCWGIDDLYYGIIDNQTGREYCSDSWYD